MPDASPYNYARFRSGLYDFETFGGPAPGEPFRDATLWTLQGEPVRLSHYLRDRPLVVETGSMTCPMYAGAAPRMQELAARHRDLDFVLIYVREAHPGERQGAHASLDAKIAAARASAERHGDRRTTLVDDVAGTAHALYGAMPNSVFVIDPAGTVLFRTIWNNADAMGAVLDAVARGEPVRARELRPAPPFTLGSLRTLLAGGVVAAWDFYTSLFGLVAKHRRRGNM